MKYVITRKSKGEFVYASSFGSGRTRFAWCGVYTGMPMYFDQPDPTIYLPKGVWWDALSEGDFEAMRRRRFAEFPCIDDDDDDDTEE